MAGFPDRLRAALERAAFCSERGMHDDVPIVVTDRDLLLVGDDIVTLRGELDLVIGGDHPVHGLESLRRSGIIPILMPEVDRIVGFGGRGKGHKDLWEHTKRVVSQVEPRLPHLLWSALFHDIGKPHCIRRVKGDITFRGHELKSRQLFDAIADRTGLFRHDRDEIAFIVGNLDRVESYEPDWSDSAVRRLHRELGDVIWDVITVARADVTSRHAWKHQRVKRYMESLTSRIVSLREEDEREELLRLPKGLGDVISEKLDIEKGPRLGKIMGELRELVACGEIPPEQSIDVLVGFARGIVAKG